MKKVITILMIIVIIISISNNVLASSVVKSIQSKVESDSSKTSEGIMPIVGTVMRLIRNISVIAGVIVLMIIGVKYMVGSIEQRADYKKSLVPLIIGIALVMSATTIVTYILSIFE